MSKGSQFEREVCRILSLWWTQDLPEPRDDCFWRTSQSGGRATVRSRKGKQTAGHYGDIAATDSVGEPLLKALVFELKRGYSSCSLMDLIDRPDKGALQIWSKWIIQAEASQTQAGSLSWAIISKRDRRQTLIATPRFLMESVVRTYIPVPRLELLTDHSLPKVYLVSFEDFLSCTNPELIKVILTQKQTGEKVG